MIGSARGWLRVVIDEQVLGGDREGTEPVRAQEKQHGVWEGVEGEVGPILRGRPRLDPREGKAAAHISCTQGPVVRSVAMKGWSLQGGWESCCCRVDLRGGAHNPQVCEAALVCEEKLERWEATLTGQDVRGGRHETIGRPSRGLMPEHGELPNHVSGGGQDVRAIAEDGKEEGGGQSVAEEGGETNPWRGETLDRHEGRLLLGQPFDEVGGSGDRGGEPVAQPSDLTLGREDRPIPVDRSIGDEVSVPVSTPVD